ncbi:helix-turn-helix transcriptional regulator [Cellulomonas denverensis]|nr:helix-turn-helix transcriptional regulator [Cellulomonas denverensis]GIG26592.1 hypothetical protein Cde04nite_28360 [Cellulomonas denverensis]
MTAGWIDDVVNDGRRWLAIGRDVLLRGDRGSGRSTALERLSGADAVGGGLVIRAAGEGPGSALLSHPSAPAVPSAAAGVPVLISWLTEELEGPRSLLAVDDIDEVDDVSLLVIRRALERVSALLVCSTGRDLTRGGRPGARALVADRAPAEIRLKRLSYEQMHRLISDRLGGPADVALTSSVMARSSGSPRIAAALVDGALFGGNIRQVEGRWTKRRPLDDIPLDSVALALTAGLPPEQVAALEVLAGSGPMPRPAAVELVGDPMIVELIDCGRVVCFSAANGDEVLSVSPPALMHALNDRLTWPRRYDMFERIEHEDGPAQSQVFGGLPELVLGTDNWNGEEFRRWSAEVAGLIQEKDRLRERSLRASWQLSPTVVPANALLTALLRRPATAAEVQSVFDATEVSPADPPEERSMFAALRRRWELWDGGDDLDPDDDTGTLGGMATAVRVIRDEVAARVRSGALDEDLLGPVQERPGPAEGWAVMTRTAALLEAGRPELALLNAERSPLSLEWRWSSIQHYQEGIVGLSLLHSGRVPDAEGAELHLLGKAYQDLDLTGIRVHATVLAELYAMTGRPQEAWRVLSTSLRLGPPGPLERAFYDRGLVVGVVNRSQAGDLTLARTLLAEIEDSPPGRVGTIHSGLPLARAAVALAEGEDPGEELWRTGLELERTGRWQPALSAWLLYPRVHPPERMARIEEAYRRVRLPLLEPYLRLHQAMTAADSPAIAARLRETGALPGGIVDVALELVEPEDVPAGFGGRGREGMPGGQVETLSAREREVALLAQEGLPNRMIAERLFLSVRTVENHMSRALRKLGLSTRADLQGLTEDWRF